MTLQQLRYFLTAADKGSFSAAAESLLMAQPSLSDQIRKLEAELGVALFTRAGRRLVLTEAGRMLRPHAERTLAAAEEAVESVKEVRTLTGGTVSFGTFDGGLEVRPSIREENHYVSASPQRTAKPKTIEDLAAAPLILYDARWGPVDPMRRQLAERAQRAGVRLEPEIEVEYLTAALDLAARRLGDTIADPSVLVTRGYARNLSSVSFDPPLYDTYAFITRRNAHLSPATREFMALAEKRVAAMGSGS
jgi:DNA-binding transcriptional LysR family regulator